MLLTQSVLKARDLHLPGILRKWAESHLPSIFNLAKEPYDLNALEELILVTGYDAAEQYAMAVSTDSTRKGAIRFQVGVPELANCSALAWGTWTTLPSVVTNSGPQLGESPNVVSLSSGSSYGVNANGHQENMHPSNSIHAGRGESGIQQPDTHVHALFIRGYRLRKRPLPPRLKIKAAAGFPALGEPDHDERGEVGLVVERTPEGVMVSGISFLQCFGRT